MSGARPVCAAMALLAALAAAPGPAGVVAAQEEDRGAARAVQEAQEGAVPEAGGSPRDAARKAGGRASAGLDDAELDRLTAEVADQLRCPVCRNQSVLESSSELARSMQGVIRERLAAGESPEEVKAYFVARYGEWILLKPVARGMNLVVYLLPAAAVLGGGLFIRARLRAWRARSPAKSEARSEEGAASFGETTAQPEAEEGLSERDRDWLEEEIHKG